MKKTAVLIMAYGSPEDLNDMGAYLQDIRAGRPTPPDLLEEITERYRSIGGSPLNRHTYAQADAVKAELQQRGLDLPVYVGMRHWTPWIKDAVARMQQDGITDVIAIVMAPHFSQLSIGKYRERFNEACADLGASFQATFIESWWRQLNFIAAHVAHVKKAAGQLNPEQLARTRYIFTAHSLPERIKNMGDHYDEELLENAQLLAEELQLADWMFAFQSAGASPEPWLGPAIEEVIPQLAGEGYQQLLITPIGFVCDHVEILFDIDIEARQLADDCGVHIVRSESMNTDPLFISAVADAVTDQLKDKD